MKALAAYAQAYDIQLIISILLTQLNSVSVIYQCIDILSNTLARIPFNIVTDEDGNGDFEDFKNNYWYKAIKYKPNAKQSDFDFRRMVATSVYTKGNGYVYISRKTNELPIHSS